MGDRQESGIPRRSLAGAKSPAPTGSLLRGLLIIRVLVDAPAPLSLADLAERTGLDPSTTLRLSQTLTEEGYVVRLSGGKRYCAGPRAISHLSPYHPINLFRREVNELIHKLRDEIGETVGFVLFLGEERLIVDIAQGREALAPFYETWLRTPLHAAASGQALLSYLGPSRLREVIGLEPFTAETEYTTTTYKDLEAILNRCREQGYIVAKDSVHVGLSAIAAPIEHNSRVIGCVVAVGSTARLNKRFSEQAGKALYDAARLIDSATPSVRQLSHYVGS